MLDFEQFPPHVRLMLLAVQSPPSEPGLAAMREILAGGQVDWTLFLPVVHHHKLGPLVFESFAALGPGGIPAEVLAGLQRQATRNAFSALRAVAELRRVSAAFAEAGYSLTQLKGVALSEALYGNPNLRHVGDLDVLVSPDGLEEQVALLGTLGYERLHPAAELTPRRTASYVRFWKDFTFQSEHSGFELDLHWRFFNNRLHPANRLLEAPELSSVEVFRVAFQALSRTDQFLYTAAHGLADGWTHLKALSDVAAFLRLLTPAELDHAFARAQSLGLLGHLSAAVHLAVAWMRAPLPVHALLLPASEPLGMRLRLRTEDLLLRQGFVTAREFVSPAGWTRLELTLVPGVRSVGEAAGRYLWRPRLWQTVNLPDRLFSLYPLVGLMVPPRLHSPEAAGQSQAAPRTPLESPNAAGKMGVSKSPPKV